MPLRQETGTQRHLVNPSCAPQSHESHPVLLSLSWRWSECSSVLCWSLSLPQEQQSLVSSPLLLLLLLQSVRFLPVHPGHFHWPTASELSCSAQSKSLRLLSLLNVMLNMFLRVWCWKSVESSTNPGIRGKKTTKPTWVIWNSEAQNCGFMRFYTHCIMAVWRTQHRASGGDDGGDERTRQRSEKHHRRGSHSPSNVELHVCIKEGDHRGGGGPPAPHPGPDQPLLLVMVDHLNEPGSVLRVGLVHEALQVLLQLHWEHTHTSL